MICTKMPMSAYSIKKYRYSDLTERGGQRLSLSQELLNNVTLK